MDKGEAELWQDQIKELPEGRMAVNVKLTNTGVRAILGARAVLKQTGWILLCSDNDVILFPGEEKELFCYLIPAPGLPFEEPKEREKKEDPEFFVEYL